MPTQAITTGCRIVETAPSPARPSARTCAGGADAASAPPVGRTAPTRTVRLGYDARMFGLDTVVVLLVVLAVVLVWRGPKMLPKWGETLGRGVKAARKEADQLHRDADGGDGTDGTDGAPRP